MNRFPPVEQRPEPRLAVRPARYRNRHTVLIYSACVALWITSACDGEAPPACGDRPIEGTPPVVHISFPTPRGFTYAMTVTVRGTAVDPDGITAIRVNNAPASSTTDFAEWQATVPLSPGENRIVVESEDALGSVDCSAAEVVIQAGWLLWLSEPVAVTVDTTNNRALVLDANLHALVSVDLETALPTVVSTLDAEIPSLERPTGLELDLTNNRVIVLVSNMLVAIDLSSGIQTVLSSPETGSGPEFQSSRVALDVANDRALVSDIHLDALVAVDLTSGDRTVISDASTGSGPAFAYPADVAVNGAGDTALVLDADLGALVAVDLASGNRAVVSDDTRGSGPSLFGATHMILDGDGNRAFAFSRVNGSQGLLSIDLTSGDRVVISDAQTGTGPTILSLVDMAFDATVNRVVLAGAISSRALWTIDLTSGKRTTLGPSGASPALNTPRAVAIDDRDDRLLVLHDGFYFPGGYTLAAIDPNSGAHVAISDDETGMGPPLESPRDMALDAANNRVLIADLNNVAAVDLTTGNRTVFSDDGIGSGPVLEGPEVIVVDSANNRAIVIDNNGTSAEAVVAIDLTSGDRTVLSNETTGSGPALEFLGYMALDEANDRLLILYDFTWSIMAIDLATGNRVQILDEWSGSGPDLRTVRGMVLDSANNRILVADSGLSALVAVDLATGDRVILSDRTVGSGPILGFLDGVALDAVNNRAFVVDRDSHAVMVIDLHSGERVVVAR